MSSPIFNIVPNTLKYVGGTPNTPNTVMPFPYQYAFGINDVGYGYTIEEYFNGITPPSGGYVVYAPTPYQMNTANDDTALIQLANVLLSQNYTTVYDAIYNLLDNNYCVFNYDLPDFPTNGLVALVQSGFSSSFDTSFANNNSFWYSMTQLGGGNFYFNALPSMSGSAIVFNGTSTLATITDPSNIPTGNSQYTISAWFNTNQLNSGGLVGWGTYGSANQVNAFRLVGSELLNYWWANDLVTIGANIQIGTWYNATCTFDGTYRTIYINGVQYAQDTPSGHNVPSASNTTIGVTNTTEFFDGLIQNVAIYNTALNAQDVLYYYEAWLPIIGTTLLLTEASINLNTENNFNIGINP